MTVLGRFPIGAARRPGIFGTSPGFPWSGYRTWTPYLVLGFAGLALLVGLIAMAFVVLTPTLQFSPGQVLTYRLETTLNELAPVAPPGTPVPRLSATQQSQQRLWIIGLDDKHIALCWGPEHSTAATMMTWTWDGRFSQVDAGGRTQPVGPGLGLFDINLLRLPDPDALTPNKGTVFHALLPAPRNQVQVSLKRTKAGPTSDYQVRFPTSVEWIDNDGRYRQLQKLSCDFKLNSSAVDTATVTAILHIESPSGPPRRWRWEARLVKEDDRTTGEDPSRLRLAVHRLSMLRSGATGAVRAAALDGLRSDPVNLEPLRSASAHMLAQQETQNNASWWLLVTPNQPSDLEALSTRARNAGLTVRPGRGVLGLGPYQNQDPALPKRVQRQLQVPAGQMRWWRAP